MDNDFSMEKVSLSALECAILVALIKEGSLLNQHCLEIKTKASVGGISKALQRLIAKGLLYVLRDSVKFYGINPWREKEINKFITGYELGKTKPIVLSGHASVYDAEINDFPVAFARRLVADSFLAYSPRGWKYAYRKCLPDGSVKFHKTKKGCKMIAYFRTFGFTPLI